VQANKVRKLAEGAGPSSPPGRAAMHKALEDNFECVVRALTQMEACWHGFACQTSNPGGLCARSSFIPRT
jgi:hypothetical protein